MKIIFDTANNNSLVKQNNTQEKNKSQAGQYCLLNVTGRIAEKTKTKALFLINSPFPTRQPRFSPLKICMFFIKNKRSVCSCTCFSFLHFSSDFIFSLNNIFSLSFPLFTVYGMLCMIISSSFYNLYFF